MSAFSTIHVPNILLPKKGVDLTKFAVIACDQFTSQKEYWDQLDTLIGQSASTLRMIFPEAYLPLVDNQSYIKKINSTIENYLQENVLENIGPAFILVERSTPYTKRRLGLVIAIDLEDYSFQKGSQTLIRATEMTILERIPPRLKIREHAPVELPHTLVLYDDPDKNIIEKLYNERANLPLIYDFELNQDGGHLRGYKVSDTAAVIDAFEQLLAKKAEALLFVVGDGNHSLATAKAHWDKIKELLSEADKKNHPARYALVEVNNLYDEGINFAPIHRIVFNASEDFIPGLKSRLTGGQTGIIYTLKTGEIKQPMPKSGPQAYKIVQDYIDQYMQSHPQASVDYIHGRDHLYAVANKHPNAVAIAMPHLGASTEEAEDNCAYMAAKQVIDFIENGNIVNSVNYPNIELGHKLDAHRLVVLHQNLEGLGPNIIAITGAKAQVNAALTKVKNNFAVTLVEFEKPEQKCEEKICLSEELAILPGVIRVRVIQ